VEVSYAKAKEVISANIEGLTKLAEQLLEKEVIFSEDLERIFGKRRGDISKSMTEEAAKGIEPAKAEEPAKTVAPEKSEEPAQAEEPLKSE